MGMTIDTVRDVVGYEGLYTIDIFGNVTRVKDNKEMSQQINKFGYANVSLCKDGKQKQHKVHRLIAQAFIPNPQNKEQVNHIDGDKRNNVVWNLEWCTPKENVHHAINTKLRSEQPIMIVETGEVFRNPYVCADAIGGNAQDIYRCLRGKTKTHKGFHYKETKDENVN